jgi:hypothetical protein
MSWQHRYTVHTLHNNNNNNNNTFNFNLLTQQPYGQLRTQHRDITVVASRGFFNTPASRAYCILAPTSSRIHLQRRHASYRCERPLPAKAGTTPQFCQRTWILQESRWDFLHAAKLGHGTYYFTSPPKEGILPEKSNGFGRVWTLELGFQWPVC